MLLAWAPLAALQRDRAIGGGDREPPPGMGPPKNFNQREEDQPREPQMIPGSDQPQRPQGPDCDMGDIMRYEGDAKKDKVIKATRYDFTNCTKVAVRGNDIGDEGALLMGPLLEQYPARGMLQELYLGNNGIGDKGCERIAMALLRPTALHTLDMSHNNAGDDCAKVSVPAGRRALLRNSL